MSDCSCGFDVGDPRVARHADNCAMKRIAELEAELKHQQHMADKEYHRYKELEAENKTLRGDLEITELRLAAAYKSPPHKTQRT